ncbi:CD59 glycoprotein [Suricata suricatta]|uniref:MAC-inhibitory protein n=1 Tax=Suricata suricatta TaxID=37032 RepID=A0A673V6L7_SURSU|nr:CD59 glycoprotein [Suricata suricatta]XP_029812300.1 CD59 glycoprotein [Suricata suricatta]XP_029812301.1 CD59 glycoprotein [Suricata suricatta]XP_029812302.1 CD59 glycoprotein [Suricata suricatta]
MLTMQNHGGFVLPVLLLLLVVLCHSGHSLMCYNCMSLVNKNCTKTSTCPSNFDACVFVEAEPKAYYYQCWKYSDCSFERIALSLGLQKLQYRCCQHDLCNGNPGASGSGKMALLVTPLLAAAWTLRL